MAVAPLHEGGDADDEFTASFRKMIFVPGAAAWFAIGGAYEDAMFDKRREPSGQNVTRAANCRRKVVETAQP